MKLNSARILEGVVVVTLLAGTAWLAQQVHHNYVVHPSTVANEGVAVAPMAVPARSASGSVAPLAVRSVPRAQLLMVVSTDCPFCEKNMPEWKRLTESLNRLGETGATAVVLSVSGADETAAYLARHGVQAEVRLVDRAVLPLLGVSGYPSTVAVDPSTGAISAWTGVLGEADHEAIMAWAEARPAEVSS